MKAKLFWLDEHSGNLTAEVEISEWLDEECPLVTDIKCWATERGQSFVRIWYDDWPAAQIDRLIELKLMVRKLRDGWPRNARV